MTRRPQFTIATDCPFQFCDPRGPSGRGGNADTNSPLRLCYPKDKAYLFIVIQAYVELPAGIYSLPGDYEHAGGSEMGGPKTAPPDWDAWLDRDARLGGPEAPNTGRQARDLHRRLARWGPAYGPLVLS